MKRLKYKTTNKFVTENDEIHKQNPCSYNNWLWMSETGTMKYLKRNYRINIIRIIDVYCSIYNYIVPLRTCNLKLFILTNNCRI